MGKKLEVKSGDRYWRLTIIEEVEPYIYSSGYKERMVKCRCDCGNPTIVRLKDLRSGKTQSCGCLQFKTNKYDLSGEYGIGYTSNTNEPFYFDLEDYELIKDYCWHISKGYVTTLDRTTGKRILLHRLVMHPENDEVVDHINRDKLDNRKANLRVCTSSDNAKNRGTRKNNVSGVTGVIWNKQASKWEARINMRGKRIHLGVFTDINEAIKVRIHSELEMFGEYAPTYNYFTEEQRKAILSDRIPSEEMVKILNQKSIDKQYPACYNKDK